LATAYRRLHELRERPPGTEEVDVRIPASALGGHHRFFVASEFVVRRGGVLVRPSPDAAKAPEPDNDPMTSMPRCFGAWVHS
jgi:hypothetical protein